MQSKGLTYTGYVFLGAASLVAFSYFRLRSSAHCSKCKCEKCGCVGGCRCENPETKSRLKTIPFSVVKHNESDAKIMKAAFEKAVEGVKSGKGGPFGAAIVQNGEVLIVEHNRVLESNDPTNHAEIVAIRAACKLLGRFSLDDCVIYSSCQPCPMCLSAIHWAKLPKCYFASSAEDAASVGFDDQFLYDLFSGEAKEEKVEISQVSIPDHYEPFRIYNEMVQKQKTSLY